jgi:polyhydroxybutyrate depolymerase
MSSAPTSPGRFGALIRETAALHRTVLLVITCASCATFASNRPLTAAAESRTTRHTITVEGRERSFYLHLPPRLATDQRYPLVVLLHGHNNNGASILYQTKMEAVADRYGFILASPNGTGRFGRIGLTWDVGTCCGSAQAKHIDDVGFLVALVDTLEAVLPVDRAHVAIAGFSAGGMLALRVACDHSSLATLYVNVQGTMPDTTCRPTRPVSMLLFAGDEDEDMQEEHAENKRHHGRAFATSAMNTLRFWARHNGCSPAIETRKAPGETQHVATGCALGTRTELVTVHGHPHAWPGGHRTWWFAPKPSRDVDASLMIAGLLRPDSTAHSGAGHRNR